jgi:hypothetical protein
MPSLHCIALHRALFLHHGNTERFSLYSLNIKILLSFAKNVMPHFILPRSWAYYQKRMLGFEQLKPRNVVDVCVEVR